MCKNSLVPVVVGLILGTSFPSSSARGAPACPGAHDGEGLPARSAPELRTAPASGFPWVTALLVTPGAGRGAAMAGPLVVIQTDYADPVDGNVALLIWGDAQDASGAVTILVDGVSLGTSLDPRGLVFVTQLPAGDHTFRIEEPGSPETNFFETPLRIIDVRPFDDPADLQCAGASTGNDGGCDVELRWTNGPVPPGYFIVLLDDSVVERTATGELTSLTVADVGRGVREWTLIGFLQAAEGSPNSLYRGSLVWASCSVDCSGPSFLRGLCNGSGNGPSITSAIFLLNYLFLGGETPSCLDACDTDADQAINVTDAVYLLDFLFKGGPAPSGWVTDEGGGNGVEPRCEPGSPDTCLAPHSACGSL